MKCKQSETVTIVQRQHAALPKWAQWCFPKNTENVDSVGKGEQNHGARHIHRHKRRTEIQWQSATVLKATKSEMLKDPKAAFRVPTV